MSQIELLDINIELTPESIRNAIYLVNELRDNLADGLSELARQLTEEYGMYVAAMYISHYDAIDSGNLRQSINGEYNSASHEGTISTDCPYAVYVEFGTGIVGKNYEHPLKGELGVEYDINGHGMGGWWYPSPKGWYKPKGGGPMLAWTRGQPSRPFMYMTLRNLQRVAEEDGARIIAKFIP